jgi:hypothetical protein
LTFSSCRDPLRSSDDPHAGKDAVKRPKAGNGAFRSLRMEGRRIVLWKYFACTFPAHSQ